ncbi:ATP-binding protein [Phaeobacter sp. 11ANDIMAR09]|uniref:ATP-binding protein n=1 Tax=Phaeobacter sp. 11ANDIMAR09 TaxID=1225647 RepID=UPI0006C85079|nr:ATP-binding protein [Phaeobacter sp. 11ANDIMAR09]KPD12105.1 ATPase [Phaeobacter sp. 11ANDIMAR09]OIQ33749.1 MAG: ATPase [Roseobacter sp. MedPE-SWchi]
MTETFACSFKATEQSARSCITAVMEGLRDIELPVDRAGDVQIALAEAVNNIVEHAYADRTDGEISIRCNLSPNILQISISDTGPPLPKGELPAGLPADISGPLETLPEGGFGWHLIRELTCRLQYERQADSNLLSLFFEMPGTQS